MVHRWCFAAVNNAPPTHPLCPLYASSVPCSNHHTMRQIRTLSVPLSGHLSICTSPGFVCILTNELSSRSQDPRSHVRGLSFYASANSMPMYHGVREKPMHVLCFQ